MATSPNYGWLEPDNTDLVKNGALAIRTLGNAIDTTMATMTPKSIVDAKGDLIAATANDTPARLAVGNNGETLVADSSASVGLRYSATPSASNPIINSAMQIWQRGTSMSISTLTYTADRWEAYRFVAGSTVSRQVTGDTANLPNIQYCARIQRNSGNTATDQIWFSQSFETVNTIPFVGKTITLSYYARAGANYSSSGNTMSVLLFTGTGTDQNITGYTGSAATLNDGSTLTTTWQRFSKTVTIPTTITEMGVQFRHTSPSGTAGAADFFEVTGVQIDIGSVALPFRTYAATFQGELAACKYYYDKRGGLSGTGTILGVAMSNSAGNNAAFSFPITMRVAPTSIDHSGLRLSDTSSGFTVSSVTLTNATSTTGNVNVATTGMTGFRSCYLDASANGNFIAFSAEL